MTRCLSDEGLELLLRGRAPWWRAPLWRRHLRRCGVCRSRWERLCEDELLLDQLRRAASDACPDAATGTRPGVPGLYRSGEPRG
jgi:hypothetical protein